MDSLPAATIHKVQLEAVFANTVIRVDHEVHMMLSRQRRGNEPQIDARLTVCPRPLRAAAQPRPYPADRR